MKKWYIEKDLKCDECKSEFKIYVLNNKGDICFCPNCANLIINDDTKDDEIY